MPIVIQRGVKILLSDWWITEAHNMVSALIYVMLGNTMSVYRRHSRGVPEHGSAAGIRSEQQYFYGQVLQRGVAHEACRTLSDAVMCYSYHGNVNLTRVWCRIAEDLSLAVPDADEGGGSTTPAIT